MIARALPAIALSAVRQAGGLRETRWASYSEVKRVLTLRGEREATLALDRMLALLVAQEKVETQVTQRGRRYRLTR